MASLLAKRSWRGKQELDAGNGTRGEPVERRPLSVRSRSSVSSLFRRQDSALPLDCHECIHYPLYDPSNPEHHAKLISSVSSTQSSVVTPKKSRLQSIVQSLQDALRAKANYFHVQSIHNQPIPSPSSSASKKSVRFQDGHFVIEHEEKPTTSQLVIPLQKSSPQLPELDFSQTPLLPICPAEPCIQEDPSIRCSPEIFPMILQPLLSTPENTFDDIYKTEDSDKRNTLGRAGIVITEAKHPATAVMNETNGDIDSPNPQSLHAEYPAVKTFMVKSNSLPLRKCRVEIGGADVFGVTAVPSGQEKSSA